MSACCVAKRRKYLKLFKVMRAIFEKAEFQSEKHQTLLDRRDGSLGGGPEL